MSDFAERLKDLLDDNNLTYQELAKTSKVSRTSLRFWLRYGVIPKPTSIMQLAKFFNCPVDYFIGKTDKTKIVFSNTPVDFAERLNSLIKEKKITPYRACMELHIETDTMSVWLNKGIYPNYENLLLLVDYFNCSADYLLGLVDTK